MIRTIVNSHLWVLLWQYKACYIIIELIKMQGRIQIRQSLVKTTFSSAEEEKGQIKVGWG